MKLWTLSTLCTASLLFLSSCATTPTPPSAAKIDTSLPIVELTKNGTIADMKTVAFEWNSIRDPRVNGIVIYRERFTPETGSNYEQHDVVGNRFQTHYLDTRVEPETTYKYKFATFSQDANGIISRVATITTLPLLASVSWIHSITGMPRTAKIIWRPHSSYLVDRYIVERKTLEAKEWSTLATLQGRLNAEFIDQELEDDSVYLYRVKVITFDGVVSKPSDVVKVITKALPHSVTNIKTTNNLPKKIRIQWDASLQADIDMYHVYRSSSMNGGYERIAKLRDTSYVDTIVEDGASYYYRVSAVDKDGLESEYDRNSIHGKTLHKPSAPVMAEAHLVGQTIEVLWRKTDTRTRSYIVERTETIGWLDKTTTAFKGITSEHFVDKRVRPDAQYNYAIYSVDKDGIKSDPSIEAKAVTPESFKGGPASRPVPQREFREIRNPQVAPQEAPAEEILMPMENIDLSEI